MTSLLIEGTYKTEVPEVDERIDVNVSYTEENRVDTSPKNDWFVALSGVLQGHEAPGTLPCLFLPPADGRSRASDGVSLPQTHSCQRRGVSKGSCEKWGESSGIAIAEKHWGFHSELWPAGICLVTILQHTQLIWKSELKLCWLSMSFRFWELALESAWHSDGCSYNVKVSALHQVKVCLSRVDI